MKVREQGYIMENSYVLQLQEPKFKEFYLSYSGYAQCGPLPLLWSGIQTALYYSFCAEGERDVSGIRTEALSVCGTGLSDRAGTQTFYQADKDDPWSYLWIGVGGSKAGRYIRDIGLNSEQLIFRSESGEKLKEIVLDILKHTEMTTANLFYLQGRLYDFFSVLARMW